MDETKKFYGKYRATVTQNIDPLRRGRLMCMVPDVLGAAPSSWCEACAPLAGPTGPPMGAYLVPPIGAGVWVEFEQGDPERPIWTGCRWGSGDVPTQAFAGLPVSPSIVLQTAGQNSLVISDLPGPTGGIILTSATGLTSLIINDTGIYLKSGKAKVSLTIATVDINDGALTVI
jgi:uncharacterized protein involved in type VI secretion and phage assembly